MYILINNNIYLFPSIEINKYTYNHLSNIDGNYYKYQACSCLGRVASSGIRGLRSSLKTLEHLDSTRYRVTVYWGKYCVHFNME